jgi:hypothetical protein
VEKKVFKVISPIERRDGVKWWMRCGSAFTNKDNSINVYLDALPLGHTPERGLTLQIRELTEEDLREREQKRASYAARGTVGSSSYRSNGYSYGSSLDDSAPAGSIHTPPTQPPLPDLDRAPF